MCLYELKTCPGLRGEARQKGLQKLQKTNKVVNTCILLFIEYLFYLISFVSPHPHCAGCRLPKIKLEILDDNGDLRRRNAKTWAAIFVPHKILLTSLKEGNCPILVGHITNVHC